MSTRALALALLPLLAACAPGGFEQGESADVTYTRAGEAPLRLVHDPLLSTVTLTPPVASVTEITFRFQDPLVELRLMIDGEPLSEGDTVPLPADASELSLTVRWDGVTYGSGPGSGGEVDLSLLSLDPGAVTVSAIFDALLVSADGDELGVLGSLEVDG
jgi:hypothetical protein